MARMNLFKDIVIPVVWLPTSAFIVLAAVIAVTMSLERTLGRPIPNLPESLPVRRNRTYIGVLICMVIGFYVTLAGILQEPWCYDGCPSPYSWSNIITWSFAQNMLAAPLGIRLAKWPRSARRIFWRK